MTTPPVRWESGFTQEEVFFHSIAALALLEGRVAVLGVVWDNEEVEVPWSYVSLYDIDTGASVWHRDFPSFYAPAMVAVDRETLVIVGATWDRPQLVWLRADGATLDVKPIGPGGQSCWPGGMARLADGGLAVAGRESPGGKRQDFGDWLVLRLDARGVTLWEDRRNLSGDDFLSHVRQLPSGDLVVGGSYETRSREWAGRAACLGDDGTMRWKVDLGIGAISAMLTRPGGESLLAGNVGRFTAQGWWAAAVDPLGRILWRKDSSEPIQVTAATALTGGGYLLAGYVERKRTSWLKGFDASGELVTQWISAVPDRALDAVCAVPRSDDVILVSRAVTGGRKSEAWVARLGPPTGT